MHHQTMQEENYPAKKGEFAKNVIKLGTGDVVAQVISIGLVPLIARLYSPEDYGIFSIYLSIVMIIFPVSTLRFNSALMLPKDRSDAANLLVLSVSCVILCSFLLTIAASIVAAGNLMPKSWFDKGFSGYIFLIPLGVFVQGTAMSVSFWALRNKMFGNMAFSRITESVIDRGLVLGFGFWANPEVLFLILGRIIGPFAALCVLIHKALIHEIRGIYQSISILNMARLARRYREFPLFSTLAFFVNNLGRSAPLLLLAMFYSPLETGFYALSSRMVQMPMMLIGDTISSVFLQRSTHHVEKGVPLAEDTKTLFSYLVYISLPVVIILICFGETLFELVFGPRWAGAGIYTQILAVSFFGMFLYRPLSALFDAFERPRARLIYNLVFLIVRLGAVIIGAYLGRTIITTLLLLTVATCALYVASFVYLFGLVGVGSEEVGKIIIKKAAIMAPAIIGIPFAKFMVNDYLVVSIFFFAMILILQSGVLLIHDSGLKRQVLSIMPFYT